MTAARYEFSVWTNRDERGIAEVAQETLHNDTINSVLLHPLKVQVHDTLASVIVQLHRLAIGCSQSRREKTIGRILADIREKVNLD